MKEKCWYQTQGKRPVQSWSPLPIFSYTCAHPKRKGRTRLAGNSQTFLKIAMTEGCSSGLWIGMIFELLCSIPFSSAGRDTRRAWQTPES